MSRCAKFFDGEPNWVYWCNCDIAAAEHLDSLNSKIDKSYDEIKCFLPSCEHIAAVRTIVQCVDAVNGITADLDVTGMISFS